MKLRDGASSAKSDEIAALSRDTNPQQTSTGPNARYHSEPVVHGEWANRRRNRTAQVGNRDNAGRGVYPTRDPQSPVRRRKGSTAKPRGIPEISQAVPEFAGEVSAAAD